MWRFVVVLFLAASLLMGGCAQAAQKAVENASGVKIDSNAKGDNVTITGQDGEKLSINTNIPDELKDFPVPNGFKSDGGGTMSANGGSFSAVSWKGQGNVKDIIDFYKNNMTAKGWTSDGSLMETDDGALMGFKKGDFSVTLTISKETDGVTIAVLGGKGGPTPQATKAKASTTSSDDEDAAEPTATKAPSKPVATPTPAAPATTDASKLPEELKDFPVPSGFSVVKDSTSRMVNNGELFLATAKWFGQGKIDDIVKFYKDSAASKSWTESVVLSQEDNAELMYSMKKGSVQYDILIAIEKTDAGIESTVSMSKS